MTTLTATTLNPIYTVSFFANPFKWLAATQQRVNDRHWLENAADAELDDMGITRNQIAILFT